jgi:hypothetical protein
MKTKPQYNLEKTSVREIQINYNNRDQYVGGFSNNQRSNYGRYIFSNKDSYEGQWAKGVPEGPGKYRFSSSHSEFLGEFKKSLPHGHGTFIRSLPDNEVTMNPTLKEILIKDKASIEGIFFSFFQIK